MNIEDIEEIVYYNLSFNIPIKETLKQINKIEFLYLFE